MVARRLRSGVACHSVVTVRHQDRAANEGEVRVANHIRITRADGRWSVRAGGAVLGESDNALELTEGDYPPVIYFPRDDIAMAFLDRTDKTTHCPHKGDANYYSVVTKSTTLQDAVWTYENPVDDVARIKDHLAFYTGDGVTVEKI
jgi:uncharacterized protein (DUF427 family)